MCGRGTRRAREIALRLAFKLCLAARATEVVFLAGTFETVLRIRALHIHPANGILRKVVHFFFSL
jgi:hypothetical protein